MAPDRGWIPSPNRLVVVALIATTSIGCGAVLPAGSAPPTVPAVASSAPASAGLETRSPASGDTAPYGGSGSATFVDMSTGIASLPWYASSLIVQFAASDSTTPRAWSMTLTATKSGSPANTALRIETTGTGAPLGAAYEVQQNGQWYSAAASGGCDSRPASEAASSIGVLAPAHLLASVVGATPAGREPVNGTTADHFTFDQAAVGMADVANGTGDLWTAPADGTVLKETLTLTGAGLPFGEVAPGTMSWAYQLSNAGSPPQIDLPSGCATATLDVPVTVDAGNVKRGPTIISFETPSTAALVVAFYKQAGKAAGWVFTQNPYVGDGHGLIYAKVSGDAITIVITPSGAGSAVVILADH
jgi:hypothetical protein